MPFFPRLRRQPAGITIDIRRLKCLKTNLEFRAPLGPAMFDNGP
jgi:hypothetical protein